MITLPASGARRRFRPIAKPFRVETLVPVDGPAWKQISAGNLKIALWYILTFRSSQSPYLMPSLLLSNEVFDSRKLTQYRKVLHELGRS